MRTLWIMLALALGHLIWGVSAASAQSPRTPDVAAAAVSLLPPVPRGVLHPEPGMYLLSPDHPSAGCVRLESLAGKAHPIPASAVVLIHGLDASGAVWSELAPALHGAGRLVLFFEYPNDQGIARSAEALGEALAAARSRGVERVDLVCHSMGGLVARDVLTRESLYAGDAAGGGAGSLPAVDRLILIATPNAGSPLAYVRAPNDLIERALAWRRADAPFVEIFSLSSDGDGQAGIDLRPGSAYLHDLNARPSPQGLLTTVIIARALADGPPEAPEVKPGRLGRVRAWWSRVVQRVLEALGDGAVPAGSAALDSADETLHVRCSHVGLLQEDAVGGWILGVVGPEPQRAPAVTLVLERVGSEAIPPPPGAGAGGSPVSR